MKNNVAYLFPGQGTNYRGSALDFLAEGDGAVRALFDLASSVFERDMEATLRDCDEQTMKRTDVAQPAITLCCLAAAAYLDGLGWKPKACAGFSLGEYPAMTRAGVLSDEDCFRLIKARGEAMQRSADRLRESAGGDASAAPGMTAIIGLSPGKVESVVEQLRSDGAADLYVANVNSLSQVVLSGTAAALKEAEGYLTGAGAKVMRLRVAGPFHSPLIADAADAFAPALESANFADPKIPLYSNVTGKRVASGAEARKLALLQITAPVRWLEEQSAISWDAPEAAVGFEACLEVGPGKVLRGFWKDSNGGIPFHGAGTVEDVKKLGRDAANSEGA